MNRIGHLSALGREGRRSGFGRSIGREVFGRPLPHRNPSGRRRGNVQPWKFRTGTPERPRAQRPAQRFRPRHRTGSLRTTLTISHPFGEAAWKCPETHVVRSLERKTAARPFGGRSGALIGTFGRRTMGGTGVGPDLRERSAEPPLRRRLCWSYPSLRWIYRRSHTRSPGTFAADPGQWCWKKVWAAVSAVACGCLGSGLAGFASVTLRNMCEPETRVFGHRQKLVQLEGRVVNFIHAIGSREPSARIWVLGP